MVLLAAQGLGYALGACGLLCLRPARLLVVSVTAHELARELLAGPDVIVMVADVERGPDECTGVVDCRLERLNHGSAFSSQYTTDSGGWGGERCVELTS